MGERGWEQEGRAIGRGNLPLSLDLYVAQFYSSIVRDPILFVDKSDAKLRVGIDDRSKSMGAEPYIVYDMRANVRVGRSKRIINTTATSVNAR